MVTMEKTILVLFAFLPFFACAQNAKDDSWLLEYQTKTGLTSDPRFAKLYTSIIPKNWINQAERIFGGPQEFDTVYNSRYFLIAFCKYHSCDEKVFFWYDLNIKKGIFVITDVGVDTSEIDILSSQFTKSEIPVVFFDHLKQWEKKVGIKTSVEEYCLSSGSTGKQSSKKLQDCHNSVLKSFENKNLDVSCALAIVRDSAWKSEPITDKNISQYNDLGYFLEQAEKYSESTILLTQVLNANPNRTVAYFNIGDAYFGLKDSVKAKNAYKTYADLMKKDGKEKKIPARVLERIK